jgi:hypothetical protein
VVFFGETHHEQAILILYFISMIFYLIAANVCFGAYKEFKAIEYESGGILSQQNG